MSSTLTCSVSSYMIISSKTRVVDMTNRRQIHIRFTGQQTGSFPSLERDDLISDISDDNERSEAGDVEGLYVILSLIHI